MLNTTDNNNHTIMNSDEINLAIEMAGKAVHEATHFFFTSGAGLGVDSGLPDFRGKNGFWKAYPPMQKLGLEFHQMSTPSWFEKDPTFAHGFFCHRYNLYTSKKPHEGYHILKEFSDRVNNNNNYFIFTSNVDGHFSQLFPNNKIEECHGSIHYLQCTEPCCEEIYSVEEHNQFFPNNKYPIEVDMDTFRIKEENLPKCKFCKSKVARPNILMFYDGKWISNRCDLQYEERCKFLKEMVKNSNEKQVHLVIIEIGAGNNVTTVRDKSELLATKYSSRHKENMKSTLIRINPTDSYFPKDSKLGDCNISIPLGGKDALIKIKAVVDRLDGK
ncbi:hypothetical protein ABK040_016529 [Willaertia magna]